MMRKKILYPVLVMACTLGMAALTSPAASDESSLGGAFLPLGWDARGEGLGGAATILIRDDRSAYWNPANITFLTSPRFSFGATRPVPKLTNLYSFVSIGTGLFDTHENPDSDVSVSHLGAALSITHLGLELSSGSGWNESTIGLSIAFAPNSYNSFGVTWRIMKSWTDLENAGAWGMAFDIGWTARLRKKFWIGVVGRNLSSQINYTNQTEIINPMWNFAIAYEELFSRISIEGDLVFKRNALNRALLGTEITVWKNLLYVLAGADARLTEGRRTIMHFGLAAERSAWEISFAYTFDPMEAFGKQYRLSFSYSI